MNPILALIIANIIWGAASPIFKFALTNIPSFLLAFIRFSFAALLFYPFINKKKIESLSKSDWIKIFVGGAIGIFINITFFFLGVRRTESINVPVIASSSPLFIFLFSVLFLKEKPKIRTLVGMIVSFFGVLVIVLAPLFIAGKALGIGEVEGNVLIIIATLGAVVQTLALKEVSEKVDFYTLTFLVFILASLLFLPGAVIDLRSWSFSQLNLSGWIGIVFGVLFSSFLAYALFLYGLSKISAQDTGIFTYIDPVAAIAVAYPLLGEEPDMYFLIGSLLIFGGIWVAENRLHWHPLSRL